MPVRSLRALVAASLVLAGALAGCVAPGLAPASTATMEGLLAPVTLLEEGGFAMDVPVEVFLLGFPEEVAPALQAKLEPEPVIHAAGSFNRAFPPSPDNLPLGGPSWTAPTQPRAVFQVRDLDAAVDAAFLEAAKAWAVAEVAGAYDANSAEQWIAEQLALARGAPLERHAPAFVIVHAGGLGEHTWRYTFSHGHLDGIRVFGELEPVTVFDVSAPVDPYVVNDDVPRSPLGLAFWAAFGPDPTRPYDWPMEATGDKTVDLLAQLTVDAAHYRFLKGPIYPVSTKACHHVTLMLAIHQTSIAEQLPGFAKGEALVDVAGLEGAFENLTGDEVSVELKTYVLPQDEPVLDALSRQAAAFLTLDALRWYLDENWEKFVTPMEGCEEYLSVLLLSDAGGQTRMFGGIGTYDVLRSHRISFSIVTDIARIQRNLDGPAPVSTKDPTDAWNVVNLLYSHETGHLFGQHHPQHLSKTEGDSSANHAFEGVRSVMSYQTGTRTIDFGAVDHATWTRGRAGYTIAEAQALGLDETPAFQSAVEHLAMGHWTQAHLALEPALLEAAKDEAAAQRLPGYEIHDWHDHPWR